MTRLVVRPVHPDGAGRTARHERVQDTPVAPGDDDPRAPSYGEPGGDRPDVPVAPRTNEGRTRTNTVRHGKHVPRRTRTSSATQLPHGFSAAAATVTTAPPSAEPGGSGAT